MSEKVIECINLNKYYGKGSNSFHALKDINFFVNRGEFIAIIGPSGSGKSTMMNILGALDTANSGDYFLNNKNISEMDSGELSNIRQKEIGFVFQSFNLLGKTNVLNNVILPLIYNTQIHIKERKKIALKFLESVSFDMTKIKNKANEISGGQMQRVAIARALVNSPSIVLADEPTGNLDSKTGDFVLKTFQKLNKDEGVTIILITHDEYVANSADRIIRIKDGMITEDYKNQKTKKIFSN
ncbi:ABC transporter ATP-binding protein [Patescibacteria group bacterium]|nr:ABC transporter ATP-binding protein [Patescibacteria group bacterium]